METIYENNANNKKMTNMGKTKGLQINQNKTKLMKCGSREATEKVRKDAHIFKEANHFNYLEIG